MRSWSGSNSPTGRLGRNATSVLSPWLTEPRQSVNAGRAVVEMDMVAAAYQNKRDQKTLHHVASTLLTTEL